MVTVDRNESLNDLVINLGRSLLQYVGEAWPWTSSAEQAEAQLIQELVAHQQQNIAGIVNLLITRELSVEFGSYPTDYTDLHYIALDHLVVNLHGEQQSLITDIEQTASLFTEDQEAADLLKGLLEHQREGVNRLKELLSS